jgi:hypothetical protein
MGKRKREEPLYYVVRAVVVLWWQCTSFGIKR